LICILRGGAREGSCPSRDTGIPMSAEWFGACGVYPGTPVHCLWAATAPESIPASGSNTDPATPDDLVSRSTGGSRVSCCCCCVGGPSRDGSRSRLAGLGCRRPRRSRPPRCPADDGEHGQEEPGAGHRPDHDQGSVDQQVQQQVNPEVPLLLPPFEAGARNAWSSVVIDASSRLCGWASTPVVAEGERCGAGGQCRGDPRSGISEIRPFLE
jgi:hypothetical protein